MTNAFETFVTSNSFDPVTVKDPWILLLGGVGRSGNRRARRFAASALESGRDVVWLDGFEEQMEDEAGTRVPTEVETVNGRLFIVGYRDAEQRLAYNRVASWVSGVVYAAGSGAAEVLGTSKSKAVAHFGRRVRRVSRRVGNALFAKFFGRVASALRGRGGYRIMRGMLESLAVSRTPEVVVYCDDYALTLAWHCARLWPDVPVSSEFTGK